MNKISIYVESLPTINLALLQNKVPFVQTIHIVNNTDQDLEDVFIKIESDPSLAFTKNIPISLIRKEETIIYDNPLINYSWDFFSNINEKIAGTLKISLIHHEECIFEEYKDIEFHSSNTWLGQSLPLELLCSHVLPNSDGVQTIIRRASDLLKENTGESSLSGYQAKSPKRVYETIQSIYFAIRESNLTYTEPAASFEKSGQKIREVNDMLSTGLGTCLDITLLFAACFEQSGLNAIIFLIEGHSFIGVWLEDKHLPRAFDEDAQFFRKRIELDEIIVIETTAVTSSDTGKFSIVENTAKEYFNNEEKFQFGIDLEYCRNSLKIYPLNEFSEFKASVDECAIESREEKVSLEAKEFNNLKLPQELKARKGEVEKWKDKLLDLTFRNKLLNFKTISSVVKIDCNNPAEMENILADGSTFELLQKAEQTELEMSRLDEKEVIFTRLEEGFKNKKLYTNLSEKKFKSTLNSIYRNNRNMQEETGSNNLFLALGFLRWQESDISNKTRESPILLLPIELKKRSGGGRFTISMRDEDSVLNHTLLQKLYRDFDLTFSGLDPLPEDESGIDVPKIFNIIKNIIKDKRGWELKEDVWLSEFTFQKFLMWKELNEHYEKMLESPVVKRIMENSKIQDDPSFVHEDKVEGYLNHEKTFCPLSADSSQLSAIFSAAEGKSFVLQGPPGTGKSQTIANMISHCLGHGKKVLFVSEKRAALEVVYKRLKSIGLGPLCLELHSKKSEKKAVIKSFLEGLEFNKREQTAEWLTLSNDVRSVRDELNYYFDALHDKSDGGISAYSAFLKSRRDEKKYRFDINISDFSEMSLEKVHQIKRKLYTWIETSRVLDDTAYQAWKYCDLEKWTLSSEDRLKDILEKYLELKSQLRPLLKTNSSNIPYKERWNQTQWQTYCELLTLLIEPLYIKTTFLSSSNWSTDRDKLKLLISRLEYYDKTFDELSSICSVDILDEDIAYLKTLLDKSKKSFFVVKLISSFKLSHILKKFQIKDANSEKIIELALELKTKEEEHQSDLQEFSNAFAIDYSLKNNDLFIKHLNRADKIREKIAQIYDKDTCSHLLNNQDLMLSMDSELTSHFDNIITCLTNVSDIMQELITQYKFDDTVLALSDEQIKKMIDILLSSLAEFREVCSMNTIKNEISKEGFKELFTALNDETIMRDDLIKVFEYNFYSVWLSKKLESSKILEQSTGNQLESKNEKFKDAYSKYQTATINALLAEVTEDKPSLDSDILPNSPLGHIIKESKKSRKIAPIRKFLSTIDSVAQSLKPCYLMSPLSVSQYLKVAPQFDIVIFDEASQIAPWDAIGSMARGKQVIVVGDSKQLPPTSFFSVNGEDEDDEKIDCESVLEMFGTLFPELYLKWHYRSRSESLISFSNYHIYDNRLHTFPSVYTNDKKVSLEVVEGFESFYDRGKSKTNKKEAQSVVDELFFRLQDSNCSNSIGIVTFSTPQSTLIEDLIDERLLENQEYEKYFNPNEHEYVFVKNLESVQGDERDIILFSIAYGKDKNGIINRNFGPLNNDGGERRLNVAVTRARDEVKVFCNFHAREFNVGSSKSAGLALLKEYMLFAEEGDMALFKKQHSDNQDECDASFEEEVANALRDKGWSVKTQIGVGGYRIDLGVVHPHNWDEFILGIECDGARYHSAKSARDRDILRESVLEGLGWNILRIWSTDWWHNQKKVLDKISNQLNDYINKQQDIVKAKVEDISNETEVINNTDNQVIEESEANYYNPKNVNITVSGDFFNSKSLVKEHIQHIVKILTPISSTECFAIIRNHWGYKRIGNQIQAFLQECSNDIGIYISKSSKETFFWNSQEEFESISYLRVPLKNEKRHPKTIAPQELMYGVYPIIKQNREVEKKELYRVVCKKLGFASLSKEAEGCMQEAVIELSKKGLVTVKDDKILLGATNDN